MKPATQVVLFVLLATILSPVAAFPSVAPCDGEPSYTVWSYYDDDWLVWNFTPGSTDSIGMTEPWWGSFLDSTVVELGCPDPCTYSGHTIANFLGGNQWMPNFGGQNLVFRQMAVGQGGVALGIDYNNIARLYDVVSQSWKTIGGSFGASANIVAGDLDHLYALANGYIYKYNKSTSTWSTFSGPNSFVQLSFAGGALFARDSSGVIWCYNYNTSSFSRWSPALAGMTQFAVGANGASAKIYGGTAAYALANGTLYRLILGDPWRWTVVPAPFTPVSIRASENSAVALDSSRRLWTLTSLYTVSEWYDPITHWHTVLGSTWENNAQLPDGITDIATGGPSDIFAFGATQNVQRLFPTSTVDIGESVAENYVGNLPNNLPNGMDFRQTGHTTLTEKCGRLGTLTLIDSFFDRYFLLAYTRVKYTNNMYNCATGNNGITLCDYSTTSWCTPETTEPTFNPTAVTDRYPPLPLGYWEAGSLCLKVLSTDPWWCSNLTSYALQTTGPGGIMPRAVCTKK